MTFALLILTGLFADGPPPTTAYYLGEIRTTYRDNKPDFGGVILLKREFMPSDSHILETRLMIPSQPNLPSREFFHAITVKDDHYFMKEFISVPSTLDKPGLIKKGETGLTRKGTLVGKPWEWTAWTSTSPVPGPKAGSLVETGKLTPGGMTVTIELSAPDSPLRGKMIEEYITIDASTYELLRSKIAPRELLQPKAPK